MNAVDLPLPQSRFMENFPFATLIGLELEALEPSYCRFGLTVDAQRHHNPQRVVHGSVLHAMADTGMGMALYTTLDEGQWCATIELKVSHFAPVQHGRLTCEARMTHRGKRVAHLEARVMHDGRLVASATGSFSIFARPAAVA